MEDIVILSGARTAIGTFGGSLAATPPIELGTVAAKAALERAGVEGAQIGHVAYGHVINTEPRDMYLSRVAAMQAGIPDVTPAMNVNRLCGSGAQAIVSVVQSLMLGDAEFGLAGGAEGMSRSPYIVPDQRWGQKMGDVRTLDMMLGALNCPFGTGHMGVTAENVSAEHQVSREEQDAFAVASAARSNQAGRSWRPAFFGLAALAAAAFLAMPTTLDVSAPAVIEPAESEMVVTPYEARLISLSARVGDRVAKGAPLGQMRSSDLAEAEKRAALDDMLERLAAQEALASGDYAKYQLAEQRAAIAAFRAEQGARRLSDLALAAPGDGRVAWAIPESRIGELIPAGEPMAEIQYGEAVRARLSIPVADGALVSAGMTGSLVVSGLAGASFPVEVLEDPIMSEDRDGRRALSVLAAVEAPADHELLKGLTGFARLDAGTAPRIWAWARPAADYLRFAAWKYLGLHL